jgi:hypothetical protein
MAWHPSPQGPSRVANPGTGLRSCQNEQARVRGGCLFTSFSSLPVEARILAL